MFTARLEMIRLLIARRFPPGVPQPSISLLALVYNIMKRAGFRLNDYGYSSQLKFDQLSSYAWKHTIPRVDITDKFNITRHRGAT